MKKKIALTLIVCLIMTTMLVVNGFSANEPKLDDKQSVNFIDAQIVASNVNLREGTSLNHNVTAILDKGTDVKILGQLGNWYAIYVPSRETIGVVDGRYVKTESQTVVAANTTSISAKVAASTTKEQPVASLSKDGQAILDILNTERKIAGLPEFTIDSSLQKVAQIKAKDMASNEYFAHNSPTFGSPFDLMRRNGLAFKSAGENISGNKSGQAAAMAWVGDNNHKVNILNGNFNHVGIGIADDEKYGKVFVAEFIEK